MSRRLQGCAAAVRPLRRPLPGIGLLLHSRRRHARRRHAHRCTRCRDGRRRSGGGAGGFALSAWEAGDSFRGRRGAVVSRTYRRRTARCLRGKKQSKGKNNVAKNGIGMKYFFFDPFPCVVRTHIPIINWPELNAMPVGFLLISSCVGRGGGRGPVKKRTQTYVFSYSKSKRLCLGHENTCMPHTLTTSTTLPAPAMICLLHARVVLRATHRADCKWSSLSGALSTAPSHALSAGATQAPSLPRRRPLGRPRRSPPAPPPPVVRGRCVRPTRRH